MKRHHYAEKHSRSLIKAISYRLLSITADSMAAYFFTHDAKVTVGIVVVANTYSTLLYYFHERAWAHIHWGHIKRHMESKRTDSRSFK